MIDIIKGKTEDTNIINFVMNLPERVGFTDDGVRRLVCAVAYANGKKIEVIKNVNKN